MFELHRRIDHYFRLIHSSLYSHPALSLPVPDGAEDRPAAVRYHNWAVPGNPEPEAAYSRIESSSPF